ncbi:MULTISPECIES: DUF1824 family protein [unclassified Cyanobium]|uniref:DUF1824 family protein n=1 Tax=unclassified Cyanobium TaxID=2627006 RepID=UPI0020CBAA47|nr:MULTISPECIES: DUF1824 family protein [unclassified Cyanobium]MCP9858066.1 DUF1824 family protein [Cyanobium sp. Cruz-8H5]MCP9865319.1 DUF1824 family protein [Cyanobium sp. Cruz-8D1]
MTTDLPTSGLAALRGLRSAPHLDGDQARLLREELIPLLGACGWFTVGIMAPSSSSAVAALRELEATLAWPTLQPGDAGEGEPGGVFLKGNQRTGVFHVRREEGLGEGILITGQEGSDPAAEDTWGPLPLDLFA